MAVMDAALRDSVRLILSETPETLTDATINDPLVGGAAEARVLGWVGEPAYELRPPGEQAQIRQAIAYLTASIVVGLRRRTYAMKSEKFGETYAYTTGELNVSSWITDLERAATEALGSLMQKASAYPKVTFFTTASGRRG